MTPATKITRDQAWEIARKHFTVDQLDGDQEWSGKLLDTLMDDPAYLGRAMRDVRPIDIARSR